MVWVLFSDLVFVCVSRTQTGNLIFMQGRREFTKMRKTNRHYHFSRQIYLYKAASDYNSLLNFATWNINKTADFNTVIKILLIKIHICIYMNCVKIIFSSMFLENILMINKTGSSQDIPWIPKQIVSICKALYCSMS